jgi:hypothetical protein
LGIGGLGEGVNGSTSEESAEDGDQHRHMNSYQPGEMTRQLIVESVQSPIGSVKPLINSVKPLINSLKSVINLLKSVINSLKSVINSLKPLIDAVKPVSYITAEGTDRAVMFFQPPLEIRDAFVQTRHRFALSSSDHRSPILASSRSTFCASQKSPSFAPNGQSAR